MSKRFILFLLLCIFCGKIASAQISDSFSDQNFKSPLWEGDTLAFLIKDDLLKLNAPTSQKKVSIATQSALSRGVSFQFKVSYSGNPSSSNHARVYLMSEKFPFTTTGNRAFYLKVGGESKNTDRLSLYYLSGLNALLWKSPEGVLLTDKNTLDAEIKVHCDNKGDFEFFIKKNGVWQSLGKKSVGSSIEVAAKYFGITVNYTKTKAKSFAFDDMIVAPYTPQDKTPPHITNISFTSANVLEVKYNEVVEKQSVQNLANHGLPPPYQIQHIGYQDSSISLSVSPDIKRGEFLQYSSKNIKDLAGNKMPSTDTTLQFYYPQTNDLIISELMIDPTPNLGKIPEAEFIEVFNPNDFPIPTAHCVMIVSGKKITFSEKAYFLKNSHTLILNEKDTASFSGVNKLTTTNSYSLRNDTTTLELWGSGTRYDSVFYETQKALPADKRGGGYALEKSPSYNCSTNENWYFSYDENGGTPAQKNSNPPNKTLTWSIQKIQQNGITLKFNQPIRKDNLPVWYLNGNLQQKKPTLLNQKNTNQSLFFQIENPDLTKKYTLSIPNISSCQQNNAKNISLDFGIPSQPTKNSLQINEILYEQTDDVPEFIEIFNPSQFFFQLQQLTISTQKNSSAKPAQISITEPKTIPPNDFLVITNDKKLLLQHFQKHNIDETKIIQTNFSLSNSGTCILIKDTAQKITIDSVCFDPSQHQKKGGGYALEKSPSYNCNTNQNWYFSYDENGGTPAQKNSNPPSKTLTWSIQKVQQNGITLKFNQPIRKDNLPAWYLNGNLQQKTPTLLNQKTTDQSLFFHIENPDLSKKYTLSIPNISSCQQNNAKNISLDFGIPSKPTKNSLQINEILYEQTDDVPEFIEIFNPSQFFFQLQQLTLSTQKNSNTKPAQINIPEPKTIPPNDFLVITNDKKLLLQHFQKHNIDETKIIQTNFSLSNSGACILIKDTAQKITIDSVCFDPGLHFNLFNTESRKGVSIEKIFANKSGSDRKNWTSAIKSYGFGSPTKPNASLQEESTFSGTFSLSQKQISPNQNGIFDQASIQYQNLPSDHLVSVSIWSINGLLVKTLTDKERLGNSGNIIWKGKGNDDRILSTGIYIILVEAYNNLGIKEIIWKESIYLHYLQDH